jgi:RNA polymerase sigma factor (sigma-70 family)
MRVTAHLQEGTPLVPTVDVPALFEKHYLALVRLAMRLVDDQESAEDLVQDVFAALPAQVDDPHRYLRTAVVNRARSALRHRRVVRAFWARGHRVEDTDGADVPSLQRAERDRMLAAIARLPQRQREVVVLRYYEDLGVAEIAAVLDTSPGSVSSALNRAMSALAAMIGVNDV